MLGAAPLALVLVAAMAAAVSGAPSQMRLSSVSVTNNCQLPVYFLEGGPDPPNHPRRIEPSTTATLTSDSEFFNTDGRVSFSYTPTGNVGYNIACVELGAGFPTGFGGVVVRQNFNLIQQEGFIDMNLEMALWADRIGGALACEDARARTTFRMSENRGGEHVQASCTSDYAVYVNEHSEWYSKSRGRWVPSARSAGFSTMGFRSARFSDRVVQSTSTGREDDGVAVNFECYEAPCLQIHEAGKPPLQGCLDKQQVSVGNSGFAVCQDIAEDT
eukprot:m51a1_g14750 hypothetical protein (273) ;mRNA; r:314996-316141